MKNLILVVYSILIAGCSTLNTSDKNTKLFDDLSLKEKESKEYIKQYNIEHPNDPLVHDGGKNIGKPIQSRFH